MVHSASPSSTGRASTRSCDGWSPDPPVRCSSLASTPPRGGACRSLWSPSPPSDKATVRYTPSECGEEEEAEGRSGSTYGGGCRKLARDVEMDGAAGRGGGGGEAKDYCQHFINTGLRPQNFIRGSTIDEAHVDNPRMSRLLSAKAQLLQDRQLPPFYLDTDLRAFDLSRLQCKFDVIVVDPPWEEYARRAAAAASSSSSSSSAFGSFQTPSVWSYEDIARLNIESIADNFCVLFLWCGSGGRFLPEKRSHLEEAHALLQHWKFRRVEDICWLKTNKAAAADRTAGAQSTTIHSLLTRTKEHCLVGMKGPFRRSRDGHLVHANIHTDLIISEEPIDPCRTDKPAEAYRVIEDFCMGRRRIDLFGTRVRPGWVTLGRGLGASNFDPRLYKAAVAAEPGQDADGKPCPAHLLGSTREIEDLRPKTPPPPGGGSRRDQHYHGLSQSPAPPAGRSGLSISKRPPGRDEQQRQENGGYRPRAYSSTSDLRTPVGLRRSDPYSPDDDQPTPSAASSSSSSRMHEDGRGRMRGSTPSRQSGTRGGGGERYERCRRRSRTPSPPPSRRSPPLHHNRRSRGKWADEEAGQQEWRPRDEHEWRGGSSRGRRYEEAPMTGSSSSSTRRRGLPSFSP